jgi:putative restriction endonuclease
MNQNLWAREQEIVALYLYCKVPFNKASNSNPDIQRIAKLIGRSVNSVKMKIGNFGNFDPELKKRGIVGLSNISKLDEDIWNEYFNHWDRLAYDAQILISKYENRTIEEVVKVEDYIKSIPDGKEKLVWVKQRINQTFFRNAVLASYSSTCCITGLKNSKLLEACHISDWSEDPENRTNPSNGLCMNSLMHKAYDNYLISVTPDYEIFVSEKFLESEKSNDIISNMLSKISHKKIILPTRFFPEKKFLDFHHQKFLKEN